MHSRPLMAAVVVAGLVATSCAGSGSAAVESGAEATTSTGSVGTSSASSQPANPERASSPLSIDVEGAGAGSASPIQDTVPPITAAPATGAPAPTAAATTPGTASTTAAPTTTATTTATTTSGSTAPTTGQASGAETRPEILRLALPKFGGGNFDPDSAAGKNVVLWFWGAH